jgi:hypothetical protein
MLNQNNHNSSCNYAEQLVSFVYGEITVDEKNVFEVHLQNCSICADEAASFGFVRSSIQEWRAEDFAKLSIPAIEINSLQKNSPALNSWLETIRAYFSPSRIGLATGFAAILIFGGLFWFFTGIANNSNVAGNRVETNQNVVHSAIIETTAPEPDTKPEISKNEETVKAPNTELRAPRNSTKEINVPARSVQVNVKNQQIVKLKDSMATSGSKINNKPASRVPKKNNIPSLTFDEYEDKSLRLSDLLEQVSLN